MKKGTETELQSLDDYLKHIDYILRRLDEEPHIKNPAVIIEKINAE